MKIIVIDDDVEVISTLKAFLEQNGHETICVESAQEGKRLVLIERPDLIMIDIRLPDIDGVELLKQIKAIDSEAVAVMITAYRDAERVIEAFRAGAFDCLLKPFNFEYLTKNVITRITRRVH
jgi:DNA-binding response OmpR family regulator